MKARVAVAMIGMMASAGASAVQSGRQQTNARPSATDPRQVGNYGVNAEVYTKADADRARCLRRKVKERRTCLAQVGTTAENAKPDD